MIILFALATLTGGPGLPPDAFPQHGAATKQNFEAMIVPPARAGTNAVEGASGAAATEAVRRLQARKTPALKDTSISPAVVWER